MIGFQQTVRGVHPTAAETLSAASHEWVSSGARDREPVGQNFRKFQNDVVLISAGVRAQRAKTHGRASLILYIYSYLHNETQASPSLFLSLILSLSSSFDPQSINTEFMHIENVRVYKNSRENKAHTCTASGNVAHLPDFFF